MGVRPASTAADGSFRIAALPPGDYTISFSLPGFNTHQHRVSVALGFTTTVDVELAVDAHEERLTVTARNGVLDRQSTALTETFDAGQLADLPGSRSMSALFEVAKSVVTPTAEGGGSVGTVGGSGSFGAYGTRGSNRPTIEGIVVSGINFGGLTIDYGSFEQASVLTGSHGAEWATPGVHIQLVAKSGGNQYHGTLYADYGNRHWQSFNVDRDQIERRRTKRRRALGSRRESSLALPRRERRSRRIHRQGQAVVVFLIPRSGDLDTPAQLPCQAPSHGPDELQRQRHLQDRARPYPRRLRASRAEPSAERPRPFRARRKRLWRPPPSIRTRARRPINTGPD